MIKDRSCQGGLQDLQHAKQRLGLLCSRPLGYYRTGVTVLVNRKSVNPTRMASTTILLSIFLAFVAESSQDVHMRAYKFPFQDPSLPWEQRVDDLVGRLTPDEIAKQTVISSGGVPAIPELDIKPYIWDTECIRGQVGTNTTAFPHSIGLGATFR